ncbi:hypothetical protein ABIB00_004635 [Bradyrhizobium sp. LB14.3]|uniref:hypothetical protein n=1 Tax=Bradyrhizobium sp. LB14.3 TaxID=3156328 RepID=UPI00339290A2
MSKQSAEPLRYDQNVRDALEACMKYLQESAEYVEGARKELPDPVTLLSARFPSSLILPANSIDKAKDRVWPTISAKLVDKTVKNFRYFDPWYFNVMLLLELSGGRFVYDKSNLGQYVYVAFAGSNSRKNFSLRRIVANTPAWAVTEEGAGKAAHYDYRRVTLHWLCKNLLRLSGKKTKQISSDRGTVVRFAVDLFQKATRQGVHPSGLTAAVYEELLWTALYIADAVHEKYLRSRAGYV